MDIDVDATIETDPEPTSGVMVRGGLRVAVDGRRLNAYAEEPAHAWPRDWYPEYVGEIPLVTLGKLFRTVAGSFRGEERPYEPVRVPLPETADAFVCEPLSGGFVRVAFRTTRDPDVSAGRATPRSACGIAVPVEVFATELLACGDEVAAVLDRLGLDDADVDRFRDRHEGLRTALES